MKATCRYTGLELVSSSGFARWCALSEHPIFAVQLDELIQLAASEWSPEMFILDKKLLMLAIAKSCDLLTWTKGKDIIPAAPSIQVVESSIDNLLSIAGWIDFQRAANKLTAYPSLRITEETADMGSFPSLLASIIESRDYTDKQERREHRLKCLENNARNLSAKCRIGANKETALLRTTADWALMVTEGALDEESIGDAVRSYWRDMLMTSATKLKAKGFSAADVDELRDFMTDYLPHGSVIAHDVIAHCNSLAKVNIFNDIDGGAILSARILQSGNLIACTSEPLREQYANIVDYARARAGWLLQVRQQEETDRQLAAINKEQALKQTQATGGDDDI